MSRAEKKVFIRARALIEKGWCQRAMAQNHKGFSTDPRILDAAYFCATGALLRALYEKYDKNEGINGDRVQRGCTIILAEEVGDPRIDMYKARGEEWWKNQYPALGDISAVGLIEGLNDDGDSTQKDVLDLYDKAIRRTSFWRTLLTGFIVNIRTLFGSTR